MRLIDAEQYAKRIYEHINAIETCPARSSIEKNRAQQQWKDALYDLGRMPIINPYEWISVKDRLPGDGETVLTIDSEGTNEVCFYEEKWKGIFQRYGGLIKIYNITHWMPLPAPPTEK